MKVRDGKKEVKDFIQYIFNWVYREHYTKGDIYFKYTLNDYKLAYLMADKSVDKRLEKKILKKLNLKTKVTYDFDWIRGVIQIEIIN